jgi:hypothetical protein
MRVAKQPIAAPDAPSSPHRKLVFVGAALLLLLTGVVWGYAAIWPRASDAPRRPRMASSARAATPASLHELPATPVAAAPPEPSGAAVEPAAAPAPVGLEATDAVPLAGATDQAAAPTRVDRARAGAASKLRTSQAPPVQAVPPPQRALPSDWDERLSTDVPGAPAANPKRRPDHPGASVAGKLSVDDL